ncbi:hypothetical protein ROA7023_03388 [Roseisalinus antarcticus]|uniref:Uncharacterized protein n=1 Tax=Roseisalinus antarcticus TaxID=254357 RepID=A0A1Y5TW47_9RHOB|nr:hypothetical protein ROA7023_03388 [Roseisalinus antarcticus]
MLGAGVSDGLDMRCSGQTVNSVSEAISRSK